MSGLVVEPEAASSCMWCLCHGHALTRHTRPLCSSLYPPGGNSFTESFWHLFQCLYLRHTFTVSFRYGTSFTVYFRHLFHSLIFLGKSFTVFSPGYLFLEFWLYIFARLGRLLSLVFWQFTPLLYVFTSSRHSPKVSSPEAPSPSPTSVTSLAYYFKPFMQVSIFLFLSDTRLASST